MKFEVTIGQRKSTFLNMTKMGSIEQYSRASVKTYMCELHVSTPYEFRYGTYTSLVLLNLHPKVHVFLFNTKSVNREIENVTHM